MTQVNDEPTKTFQSRNLHQQVTDVIIAQLEAGTVPWHKPWTGDDNGFFSIPQNFTTGNRYRGINILLLWSAAIAHDFPSQEWASFKQWQGKNEAIRKGEKGSLIVYYDTMEKEVEAEIKNIPFLKSSIVFNRSQLVSYVPKANPRAPFEDRIPAIEQFVMNTDATVLNENYGACYVGATDKIYMPYPDDFTDTKNSTKTEAYYSVMMHELTHWTGHPKRLNRKLDSKFGDQAYAHEELVAELGAAFLCADLEITNTVREDHASYIAHWLKVLKENNRCLFAAASEATKAVTYLQDLQPKG